jgi:hypothetical protein
LAPAIVLFSRLTSVRGNREENSKKGSSFWGRGKDKLKDECRKKKLFVQHFTKIDFEF